MLSSNAIKPKYFKQITGKPLDKSKKLTQISYIKVVYLYLNSVFQSIRHGRGSISL